MLQLQTKASEGVGLSVEGRKIEKVYCLNDTYPESSDNVGFTVQVFELDDGTFMFFPPVESKTAEYYTADSLSDVYDEIRDLRDNGLMI